MDIVIAGGHGQIGRLLGRQLSADGHKVRGIIRSGDQAADLTADDVVPVVLDLETAGAYALAQSLTGADAVVFAAGAGAGSGAQRKETVDYGAAVKLVDAAQQAEVGHYVMVSSMGADESPEGDDVFSVYLRAKARADRALMQSDLRWTIVRPGKLTDAEPTGRVTVGRGIGRGEVPRADVAAVLAAVLEDAAPIGEIFEVISGDEPIHDALQSVKSA